MSSLASSAVINDTDKFRSSQRGLATCELIQALIDHGADELKALMKIREKVFSAR